MRLRMPELPPPGPLVARPDRGRGLVTRALDPVPFRHPAGAKLWDKS
jgi:hypothetical protein